RCCPALGEACAGLGGHHGAAQTGGLPPAPQNTSSPMDRRQPTLPTPWGGRTDCISRPRGWLLRTAGLEHNCLSAGTVNQQATFTPSHIN
uniref:Uncharacterized protein n=1 Tax=Chelydra serpentina TaxID=8475 RepID=A0A8C3RLW1_CHESE